ncbi:MAG: nucleotidyltransferase family protein [Kiloniellaceae bacterium]
MLLRQARRARVLSRFALAARDRGLIARLPDKVRQHFAAASVIAANHDRAVRWEINRIERALADLAIPILLLKGAAYVAARLPPARGRLVSDIDIMVPEDALDAVRTALQRHGWEQMKLDPYDQRYYRLWMHELPPLRHRERQTVVDVHHTILPKTSRLKPDPQKLWHAARGLERPPLYTLGPADMVLHSAAHLFHDSDLNLGIRDVTDIGDLLQHFAAEDGFWQALVPRARELDLARPLFYALRYTTRLLGTPVSQDVMRAAQAAAPSGPVLAVMDRLAPRVLLPDHPDRPSRRTGEAALLLFIRSHWLRMPPVLLAAHLTRKALRRSLQRRESPP